MIPVSLLLNIVVLVPVCLSMLRNSAWVEAAYGPPSAARGILLSIYLAILTASIALLAMPSRGAILCLLALQCGYKLMTPFTVGTLRNPVVLSNLGIAAVHAVTLATA
ncbi:hypothetical protein [Sphingomonas azotifigens]|uniref:hypothetical protein n=1 Tax=Sphingomonas azotifigens TaxID=330920 RepID=UPI0009FD7831|nr:hypothetical protein [Sphingomonas azotifigens]